MEDVLKEGLNSLKVQNKFDKFKEKFTNLLGDTDNACKNFEMAKVFGGEEVADMYHAICDGSW